MPSTGNLPYMELLFNYIKQASTVPLSCSVTQIVIDSSISASKKSWNVQFVRLSVIYCHHRTPTKRHPYRGFRRENIFRHAKNFFIFDPRRRRKVSRLPEPLRQSNLHSVPFGDHLPPRRRSLEKVVVKHRSLHRYQLRRSAMPGTSSLRRPFNNSRTHRLHLRLTRKSRARPRRHHPRLNGHVIPHRRQRRLRQHPLPPLRHLLLLETRGNHGDLHLI